MRYSCVMHVWYPKVRFLDHSPLMFDINSNAVFLWQLASAVKMGDQLFVLLSAGMQDS